MLPDFLSLRHHKNWLWIFNKLFIYFHILMKISQNFSKFWKLQQLKLKTWDNFLAKFSVTGIFCHFYVTFEIHVLITQVFISKFLASTLLALDFWTLNWKFKCASGKDKSAETRQAEKFFNLLIVLRIVVSNVSIFGKINKSLLKNGTYQTNRS